MLSETHVKFKTFKNRIFPIFSLLFKKVIFFHDSFRLIFSINREYIFCKVSEREIRYIAIVANYDDADFSSLAAKFCA